MKKFKDLKAGDHLYLSYMRGNCIYLRSYQIRHISKENGHLKMTESPFNDDYDYIPYNHLNADRILLRCTMCFTSVRAWHKYTLKQIEKRYQEFKQIKR